MRQAVGMAAVSGYPSWTTAIAIGDQNQRYAQVVIERLEEEEINEEQGDHCQQFERCADLVDWHLSQEVGALPTHAVSSIASAIGAGHRRPPTPGEKLSNRPEAGRIRERIEAAARL